MKQNIAQVINGRFPGRAQGYQVNHYPKTGEFQLVQWDVSAMGAAMPTEAELTQWVAAFDFDQHATVEFAKRKVKLKNRVWDYIESRTMEELGYGSGLSAARIAVYQDKERQAKAIVDGNASGKEKLISNRASELSITDAEESNRVLRKGRIYHAANEEMGITHDNICLSIDALTALNIGDFSYMATVDGDVQAFLGRVANGDFD